MIITDTIKVTMPTVPRESEAITPGKPILQNMDTEKYLQEIYIKHLAIKNNHAKNLTNNVRFSSNIICIMHI